MQKNYCIFCRFMILYKWARYARKQRILKEVNEMKKELFRLVNKFKKEVTENEKKVFRNQ